MTTSNVSRRTSVLEKIVRHGDMPLWPALFRIGLGFVLIPAFAAWDPDGASDWRVFAFFLLILLLLRVVPAILRHLLPFSQELQRHWFDRRLLAKHYDSYQWRKLLWFGLGLAAYLALRGTAQGAQGVLAVACLLTGALGEVRWRYLGRTNQAAGIWLPKQISSSNPAQ
jgi:hypothetical protein